MLPSLRSLLFSTAWDDPLFNDDFDDDGDGDNGDGGRPSAGGGEDGPERRMEQRRGPPGGRGAERQRAGRRIFYSDNVLLSRMWEEPRRTSDQNVALARGRAANARSPLLASLGATPAVPRSVDDGEKTMREEEQRRDGLNDDDDDYEDRSNLSSLHGTIEVVAAATADPDAARRGRDDEAGTPPAEGAYILHRTLHPSLAPLVSVAFDQRAGSVVSVFDVSEDSEEDR